MRIALLGTRGIPARYGGFETFAEEISVRLAERGHEVTVYCRERHPERVYRGVRLRYLPTIRHKYLDTVAHTALSTADLLFRRFERASKRLGFGRERVDLDCSRFAPPARPGGMAERQLALF